MKLKKMTAVLGATALVVSCLGGCGSGKDESASASKTTAKSADDVDLSEKVDISIGGALCRYRHNSPYADILEMPTFDFLKY